VLTIIRIKICHMSSNYICIRVRWHVRVKPRKTRTQRGRAI